MTNDELRDRISKYTTSRATVQELTVDGEKQQCWNSRTERFIFTVETRYGYLFVQVVDQTTSHDRPIAFLYDSTLEGIDQRYEIGPKVADLEVYLDRELLLDDLASV